jgi:hypothetical protein
VKIVGHVGTPFQPIQQLLVLASLINTLLVPSLCNAMPSPCHNLAGNQVGY